MIWLESMIYGLISGLSKFLPISSSAHQAVLNTFFGVDHGDPVRDLLVNIALLFALVSGFKLTITQVSKSADASLHRKHGYNQRNKQLDLRLLKNAMIPLLITQLILSYAFRGGINLLHIAFFLVINGIILFIPERMMQGNKDARSMSILDSYLIGLFSAFSAIPGLSGIGCSLSFSISRGADKRKALNWAALLCIPALLIDAVIDLFSIFSAAGAGYIHVNIFGYLLSAAGAYLGGYCSILIVKLLTARNGISGFAYYSWGAALFSFMLYLTVV